MKQMLIVYYTWSNGNTEKIARELQRVTGAALERIEMMHPYSGSYEEVVAQGRREVNDGFMPEIKALQHDLSEYEAIAVGTPTWWYTMAPAVKSFFHGNDFGGKKIVLFQTHGGWPGHTLKDMKAECAGSVEEVEGWLAAAKRFLMGE